MVTYRVDNSGVRDLFAPGGEVAQFHRRTVRQVRAEIVRRCPVDTGRLRSSWRTRHFSLSGTRLVSTVYSDVNYVNYVIRGRGPVVPVRRQFLRFRGRTGDWVFAKRVRGVPPNDFVQNGLMAGAGSTHRVRLKIPR